MSLSPDFTNELRKHFIGDIRDDLGSRILYSTDASMYQIEPLGVALPRTQEDLIAGLNSPRNIKSLSCHAVPGRRSQARRLATL